MTKTNPDVFYPKQHRLIRMAKLVTGYGTRLQEILQRTHASPAGGAVSSMTRTLLAALASHCADASALLDQRLDEMYAREVPRLFDGYLVMKGEEATVRRMNMARECEQYVELQGVSQFQSGWAALDLSARQSRSERQKHLVKELAVMGVGIVNHYAGVGMHLATLFKDFGSLRKAQQLELGLRTADSVLRPLDVLYNEIENLCLFLHFLPTSTDTGPIDGTTARERFRQSVGTV